MSNRIGIVLVIIVNNNGFFRQSAKRQRLDKFGRVFCHRHLHIATRFLQKPQNFNRFICRDAARNAETNAPILFFFAHTIIVSLTFQFFTIKAVK